MLRTWYTNQYTPKCLLILQKNQQSDCHMVEFQFLGSSSSLKFSNRECPPNSLDPLKSSFMMAKLSTSTVMTIGSSCAGSMTLNSSFVKSIGGVLGQAMTEFEFTN